MKLREVLQLVSLICGMILLVSGTVLLINDDPIRQLRGIGFVLIAIAIKEND